MTAVDQAWKAILRSCENLDDAFQETVKTNRMYFFQKKIKNN